MMNKQAPLPIDEELAIYTDQFLDDDSRDLPQGDVELRALAETVLRLGVAFGEEIDPNKAEEIRKRVTTNWLHKPKTTKRAQPKRKNWFSWTTQRRLSLGVSFAITLILIILFPALLMEPLSLTASAGIFSQRTVTFVALVLFVAAFIILRLRKKK
jgi:hypothetical protein